MDPFTQYGLPLLRRMAEKPLNTNQPILEIAAELGIEGGEAYRLLELLRDDGYIEFEEHKAFGGDWVRVRGAQLAAGGLAALDLWPADGEQVARLLDRLSDALESTAEELAHEGASDEDVGRVRAAREVLIDFGARTTAWLIHLNTT